MIDGNDKTFAKGRRLPIAIWVILLASVVACSQPPTTEWSDADNNQRIKYFLTNVCIPRLSRHVPFEEVVRKEQLKSYTNCNIQDCPTSYCSSNPKFGCIAFEKDFCTISIRGSGDFDQFDKTVANVVSDDPDGWRVGEPRKIGGVAYGHAYCNTANTARIETFGARPDQITKSRAQFDQTPEYDVRVSSVWGLHVACPPKSADAVR